MQLRTRTRALIGVAALGLAGLGPVATAQETKPTPEGPTDRIPEALYYRAEVSTKVLTLKPEGTRVAKGDEVGTLDPTPLERRLRRQEIVIRAAEADLKGARLAREAADLSLKAYVDGTYKQERAAQEAEVAEAKASLKTAREALERSKKDDPDAPRAIADGLNVKKYEFTVEQAETKLEVLEHYTKDKMTKGLKAAIEKAKADELGKTAALGRARTLEAAIRGQIKACKLLAPAGGRLARGRIESDPIEVGTTVREGQLLIRIVPDVAPPP